MEFIDRFVKPKTAAPSANPFEDQAVLIYFKGEDLEGSIPLQDKLYELLENNHIGVFDGNEVGGNELVLFLHGPDAELLFEHVAPTLLAQEFCRGAKVVIRKGGPNAPHREIIL